MTRGELIDIMIKHIPATDKAETFMAGISSAACEISALQDKPVSLSPYEGIMLPEDLKAIEGISLRDYFAGLMLNKYDVRFNYYSNAAIECYKMADAMLAERDKKQ